MCRRCRCRRVATCAWRRRPRSPSACPLPVRQQQVYAVCWCARPPLSRSACSAVLSRVTVTLDHGTVPAVMLHLKSEPCQAPQAIDPKSSACIIGPLDIEVSNSRLVSSLSREGLQRLTRLAAQCTPPAAAASPASSASARHGGGSASRRRRRTASAAEAPDPEVPARLTKDEVQEMAQRCVYALHAYKICIYTNHTGSVGHVWFTGHELADPQQCACAATDSAGT